MKRVLPLFITALIFCAVPAYAHPHLFIKPCVGLVSVQGSVTALRIRWIWDEWWSGDVKKDCDKDKNNSFSGKEIDLVKKNHFNGVEDFDYFLKILADGKKVKIGAAKNFTARILPDGNVEYGFTIGLPKERQPKNKLEIIFSDDTIYTAFEDDVFLDGGKKIIKKKTSSPYNDYGVKLTILL